MNDAHFRAAAFLLASVALPVGPPVSANELGGKLCIFAAARKTPEIPGLRIVRSSAEPVPQDREQQAKRGDTLTEHWLVTLDIEAAAQTATLQYDCSTGPAGTNARPLGMSR